MRSRFLLPFLAASGFAALFGGACSDWSSLYQPECGEGLVASGGDCIMPPGTGSATGGDSAGGASGGNPGGGDAGGDGGPPPPTCGNGKLDIGEVCDDGNTENSDSCLGGCSWATCGDGFVREGVERCDDGNIAGGDSCAPSCLICGEAGTFYRSGTGHCYVVHDEELTYDEAKAVCGLEGGYVLTSTSTTEAGIIKRQLVGGTREAWLGMTLEDGQPIWITGELSGGLPWIAGEPKDLGCGVQFGNDTRDENFRSVACSESRAFVCEHEPARTDPASHHAYRRWFVETTREGAVDLCASEGGALVALETEEERAFVQAAFPMEFWVSGMRASANDYEWASGGEVIPVDEMADTADTQTGNDCLFHSAGELFPGPCDVERALVCEFF